LAVVAGLRFMTASEARERLLIVPPEVFLRTTPKKPLLAPAPAEPKARLVGLAESTSW
jgi:hypothetical protein